MRGMVDDLRRGVETSDGGDTVDGWKRRGAN